MLKLSLYSKIIQIEKSYFLFNSERNLFAEISEDLYQNMYNRDFAAIAPKVLKSLIDKRVIVREQDQYLYYNEAKMKFTATSHSQEEIGLVLIPSSGCNFACPYCFEETKKPQLISNEVIDNLILFLNKHTNAKKIKLTWYGGEPLIAFDRMKIILEKIQKETNLQVTSHSIITNGYLLDESKFAFFRENKLSFMQITLDGIKQNHDKTRFLAGNGKSTFDVIYRNIIEAVNAMPDCHIAVRVNVNRGNENDFFAIYNELGKKGSYPNLSVYPGFIREETKDACSLCYNSINACGRNIYSFYKKLESQGANVNFFPRTVSKGCMVNEINSYIVGSSGEIYKCWNDVSNEKKIIGYINKKEIKNKSLFYRYMNETSLFEDPKCKECTLFPVCSGGCAWYRYKNNYEKGNYNLCSLLANDDDLTECLLNSLSYRNDKTVEMLRP